MEVDALVERARQALLEATLFNSQALIFVHGYNVSFENALRRAGQIVHDLRFDGPAFLFSWPSRGRLLGYIADRDAVDLASSHLRQFLERTVAAAKPTRTHIIAHSMGNMVVLRALEKINSEGSLRLGEVINAAPDIDVEQYSEFVERCRDSGAGVTLYASSADWALWLSGKLSRPRAGYITGNPVPIKGAETIDITKAGMGLFSLNHDIYASNIIIVEDMRGILRGDRPPDKRTAEFTPFVEQGSTYWRYQPK